MVVEDTIDADGNRLRRTIWGLDDEARNLREVRITYPNGSAQFCCQSWKLNVNADARRFRLAEHRTPAAYNVTSSSSSTPRTTASPATTPTRQTPAPA